MVESEHSRGGDGSALAGSWLESLVKVHRDGGLEGFDRWTEQQVGLAGNPSLLGDSRKTLTIRAAIERDIRDDEQRIHSRSSSCEDSTFKHVLLPVWASAYRYVGKTYRLLVNARTGQVAGERSCNVMISLPVLGDLIVLVIVVFFAPRS